MLEFSGVKITDLLMQKKENGDLVFLTKGADNRDKVLVTVKGHFLSTKNQIERLRVGNHKYNIRRLTAKMTGDLAYDSVANLRIAIKNNYRDASPSAKQEALGLDIIQRSKNILRNVLNGDATVNAKEVKEFGDLVGQFTTGQVASQPTAEFTADVKIVGETMERTEKAFVNLSNIVNGILDNLEVQGTSGKVVTQQPPTTMIQLMSGMPASQEFSISPTVSTPGEVASLFSGSLTSLPYSTINQ